MAAKKTRNKSAAKKSAANKKGGGKPKLNALGFARAFLRRKPKASFAEVRDAAQKKKLKLYPISYGRAQALEGIVKVSPYGSKKKAKSGRGPGRPKGSVTRRGPGRPRKQPTSGLESIENLVTTIKTLQNERDRAMSALDKIRRLLADL